MTTYTIIWQTLGEYIYDDRGPRDISGYLRGEIEIEAFQDREQAARRYAFLQETEEIGSCHMLINGIDYNDLTGPEFDELDRLVFEFRAEARAQMQQEREAAREAAAQAALEEARRIAARHRQHDEAQFEALRQKLGK